MKRLGPVGLFEIAAALAILTASPSSGATIAVTTADDSGPGSLREAIERANGTPGTRIEIPDGEGLEITLERQLPALRGAGTVLDGGGVTLRESKGCQRSGGKKGCDGLVISGRNVTVRDVRVSGFLLDGIAVRGPNATGVRVQGVHAFDNLDDGIGVSDGAGPVTIEHAILMGNGFRTKGKGVLVFSDAKATVRDSVVIANRDGVTVSRRSNLTLERVVVAGNFDKGIGASAASVRGSDVSVLANGLDGEEPVPNGDGVRAGLDGRVELRGSLIAGNGDNGVVVLDTSRARLIDCRIEANGGAPTSVARTARFSDR